MCAYGAMEMRKLYCSIFVQTFERIIIMRVHALTSNTIVIITIIVAYKDKDSQFSEIKSR